MSRRRATVAAAALAAAMLLAGGRLDGGDGRARADEAVASARVVEPAAAQPIAKKDQYLLDKQRAQVATGKGPAAREAALSQRVGKPAPKIINVFNTWTHEWIAVDGTGKVVPAAEVIGRFLRCHYTNQGAAMDAKLLRIVVDAARHFGVDRVDVVSGFRAPKYNLMLRKKGHEVARDSQHTHGNAIDFRLPGVPLASLHAWARSRRLGGVGLYVGSNFIHMDTGRIRYWGGE